MPNTAASVFQQTKQAVSFCLRQRKLRWSLALAAEQMAPLFEAAFIACLYLILDTQRREALFAKLAQWPWLSGIFHVGTGGEVSFLALASLLLIGCSLSLKLINQLNMVNLTVTSSVEDGLNLTQRYLFTSATLARAIGKERIVSSILLDCGSRVLITRCVAVACGAMLAMLVYLVGAFSISWQMLLVAMLIYIVPFFFSRPLYAKLKEAGKLKIRSEEKVIGFFEDLFSGFERCRLDALEGPMMRHASKVLREGVHWNVSRLSAMAWLDFMLGGLPLVGLLTFIYVGIKFFDVSLVALTALLVIIFRLKSYLNLLSNTYVELRDYQPRLKRFNDIAAKLQTVPTFRLDVEQVERPPLKLVQLEEVHFRYDHEPVLRGVDFTAQAGDRILIQGPSGMGKSTLLEVLCGLLPPDQGRVLYDGRPLTQELFYEYRREMAFVSSTVWIFDDTMRNNLLLGEALTPERLQQALRLAKLDEVVRDLPYGLDTRLGVNGKNLSQGQRQRLLLARIYLKQPRLLLLDEATANLDPATENEVISAMLSFIDPSAILVMIAHKAPPGISFNKRLILQHGVLHQERKPERSSHISV